MAREDWFFWVERYFFGCICPGAFTSVDEVRERIDVVLGVIAASQPPSSPIMSITPPTT